MSTPTHVPDRTSPLPCHTPSQANGSTRASTSRPSRGVPVTHLATPPTDHRRAGSALWNGSAWTQPFGRHELATHLQVHHGSPGVGWGPTSLPDLPRVGRSSSVLDAPVRAIRTRSNNPYGHTIEQRGLVSSSGLSISLPRAAWLIRGSASRAMAGLRVVGGGCRGGSVAPSPRAVQSPSAAGWP